MLKNIMPSLLAVSTVLCAMQTAEADNNWKNNRWNNRNYSNSGYTNARVESRQNQANGLIMRGLANGRLTQSEANRLMAQQQKIDRLQAQFSANGNMNRQERNRLDQEVSKLRSQLNKELNDRQIRW